jgi:hypothetical protein
MTSIRPLKICLKIWGIPRAQPDPAQAAEVGRSRGSGRPPGAGP